ncbi:sensor histidine kinase [Desulfatitalea alkaliphila]|uniref:histidine kinase n=1 Tax=Desulfatitalea alkaliphila TaxID=2929485 RepID=A0AA41UQP9_9BACT|nr:ATP-binding protein [Desulfatitalea alkaliphila]MCJ8501583.1 ATP-binding protein [Desulfatitalea alkaliphila]
MRGFRSKIALYVAFLLLLSALLADILAVLFAQGVLVRDHLSQQRRRMEAISRLITTPPFASDEHPPAARAFAASDMLRAEEWSALLLVDEKGQTLFERTGEVYGDVLLQRAAATALRDGSATTERLGSTWAVFWWHPSAALIAVPMPDEGRGRFAMAAVVPLTPLYDALRQYNKPVLIMILFNTTVLCLAGIYRIFRIYLRPIDRIVRQADAYDDQDDMFFTFRREDSELNRLSSALNRMLKRIAEDREALTRTVARLEQSNAELQLAQKEIIRSEKMAAVGRLAAGIAHEIGNPIGIVLGYLDLLKRPDLEPAEHDDFARRAEDEIQRINTIITQLLDLARPKESGAHHVSAHAVIEDLAAVMAHQPMMAEIQLQTRLAAVDDGLWVNGDQLRQVLLNLLINAADAIQEVDGQREAGRIVIATTATDGNNHDGLDRWLTIAVEDNGAGISADQLDVVFDPFYSTKPPGRGTGLGLAVSYMIVEQMGGTITVESPAGRGTVLALRLPLARPGGPPQLPQGYGSTSEGDPHAG